MRACRGRANAENVDDVTAARRRTRHVAVARVAGGMQALAAPDTQPTPMLGVRRRNALGIGAEPDIFLIFSGSFFKNFGCYVASLELHFGSIGKGEAGFPCCCCLFGAVID